MKLNTSPTKKPNQIRSPLKEQQDPEEDVINNLKAIEELQYD